MEPFRSLKRRGGKNLDAVKERKEKKKERELFE